MNVIIMANERADLEEMLKVIRGTMSGSCVMGDKAQVLQYLTHTTPDTVLIGGADLASDASVINQVRTLLAKAGRTVSTRMLGRLGELVLITTRKMQ